jgi:predicted membrane protein
MAIDDGKQLFIGGIITLCLFLHIVDNGSIKRLFVTCFFWAICAFTRVWYSYKKRWISLHVAYTIALLFTFVLSTVIFMLSLCYAYANQIENYIETRLILN